MEIDPKPLGIVAVEDAQLGAVGKGRMHGDVELAIVLAAEVVVALNAPDDVVDEIVDPMLGSGGKLQVARCKQLRGIGHVVPGT